MKRILLCMTCAVLAAACTKKSNNTSTGSQYSMTANIGGTLWRVDSTIFNFTTILDTAGMEIIGWIGYFPSSSNYYPQIEIHVISGYHGTGTYTFSNPGNNYAKLIRSSVISEYSSTGSLAITGTYPTVTGTFNFTTSDGTVVSNGSFTAERQ